MARKSRSADETIPASDAARYIVAGVRGAASAFDGPAPETTAPESNGQAQVELAIDEALAGPDAPPEVLSLHDGDVEKDTTVADDPGPDEAEVFTPAPPPSDAEAALRRIAEAQHAVDAAKAKMDAAKERAKMAREAWEFRVEELGRIIQRETEPPPPLFGGPLEPASTAAVAPEADGPSAAVEVLGLTETVLGILRAAGLPTIAHLGDWTASGKPLTDIEAEVDGHTRRITEARAEQIIAALDRFWAERGMPPEAADPADSPDSAEGQGEPETEEAELAPA